MATLAGRAIRTVIHSLEVVSDDSQTVLMLDRGTDGSVVLKIRKAHEDSWSATGPRFNVVQSDAAILAQAINGSDVQYSRKAVEEVPVADFRLPNPEPVEDPNKPDCSQLDIERARAENLREEREVLADQFRLDHSRDKHYSANVVGCPTCEAKVIPSIPVPASGNGHVPELDVTPF
jgi:hypothetical protein